MSFFRHFLLCFPKSLSLWWFENRHETFADFRYDIKRLIILDATLHVKTLADLRSDVKRYDVKRLPISDATLNASSFHWWSHNCFRSDPSEGSVLCSTAACRCCSVTSLADTFADSVEAETSTLMRLSTLLLSIVSNCLLVLGSFVAVVAEHWRTRFRYGLIRSRDRFFPDIVFERSNEAYSRPKDCSRKPKSNWKLICVF